jgi:cyanophycin synthetase
MLKERDGSRWITIWDGARELEVVEVGAIPATWDGRALHNVDNAMFAVAITAGFSVDKGTVHNALHRFQNSLEATPARLNFFEGLPFTVILDFVHNAHGYEAIGRFVSSLDRAGKRILVTYAQEDNRIEDLDAMANVAARYFDLVVCRGTTIRKKFTAEELAGRLAESFTRVGVSSERISTIPDLFEAVAVALSRARPGDLVFISVGAEPLKEVWAQLERFRDDGVNSSVQD